MNGRLTRALVALVASVAVFVPVAAADAVYHTEHLALAPVDGAPLRSGFVQNIKAQGPQVYAHELFVLNGAAPDTTYTVTRNFFFLHPGCDGGGSSSVAGTITTNAAGNGTDGVVVPPEGLAGLFVGEHGVFWTVTDASGTLRYQTSCTTVTLD
jgi:hypothetical protein